MTTIISMDRQTETKRSFGGIQIRNQEKINNSFSCGLCQFLLFIPIQLMCCGTRLCRWCSNNGLSNSKPFNCPYCHIEQPEKQARIDRGGERDLNMMEIECYSCSWTGSYKDYQGHLQEQHADFECADCLARFFTRNSFEEHRQEICEHRRALCGLPNCLEPVKLSAMHTHYLSDNHQLKLRRIFSPYISSKRLLHCLSNRFTTTADVRRDRGHELVSIEGCGNTPLSGIDTLFNDCKRLRSECDQLTFTYDTMILQIKEANETIDEYNEKLLECIQVQDETDEQIEESKSLYLSTQISLLGDDGTITFPFSKYRTKINLPFSIDSPKFKTSPHGYLFKLRVCSTINVIDNQKYLSIYMTLLPGDFDPILFYPFPYKISFTLCDQSGKGKDVTTTIVPDPNSPSFARPTSGRNDEIGIVKFCPLGYLTDLQSVYLRNGVFFIKISFNFLNIG